jgi:arylsulfatase A-like enzyme
VLECAGQVGGWPKTPSLIAFSAWCALADYPEFWYHVTPTFNGTFNFTTLPQAQRYETAFIENFTVGWLKEHGQQPQPFFAYIAPHAPHGAAIPAPWYQTQFPNATSPITPSWNYSGTDHHWLVAQQPPTLPNEVVQGDEHFRNRWRCLRSVDDLIVSLRATLDELKLTQSTYFFFTSDHGFHFHELRLGVGKWNVYVAVCLSVSLSLSGAVHRILRSPTVCTFELATIKVMEHDPFRPLHDRKPRVDILWLLARLCSGQTGTAITISWTSLSFLMTQCS